jgi:exopolysaccharide production protein ExoZ
MTLPPQHYGARLRLGGGTKGMVLWVHLLRAAAALAVMVAHANQSAIEIGIGDYVPDFPIGAAGVDLFFVISGFVMVVASADLFGQRGAPPYFFLRRLARIVPLYWLITGIFVFILFAGRHHSSSWLSASEVVTSLLFIPHSLPNGAVVPVYGLGWTLNYEMMFYVAFSAVLFLRPRVAIPMLSVAMLWLAYIVPRYSFGLPVSFWANPIIVEFVFGMIIGLARLEGYRMPNWLAVGLVLAALCWFAASAATFWLAFSREFCWGLPAAAMIAGAGLCRTDMLSRNWLARSLILVGDASYALYLVHPLAALAPYKAFGWLVPPASLPYLYAAALYASSIAAAILIHLMVERPTTRFLQRRVLTGLAPRHAAARFPDTINTEPTPDPRPVRV